MMCQEINEILGQISWGASSSLPESILCHEHDHCQAISFFTRYALAAEKIPWPKENGWKPQGKSFISFSHHGTACKSSHNIPVWGNCRVSSIR